MNDLITFIKAHYDEFSVIFSSIILLATTIVKITPSTKDDSILNKILSFIEKLSLVNTKTNQEAIDNNKSK